MLLIRDLNVKLRSMKLQPWNVESNLNNFEKLMTCENIFWFVKTHVMRNFGATNFGGTNFGGTNVGVTNFGVMLV